MHNKGDMLNSTNLVLLSHPGEHCNSALGIPCLHVLTTSEPLLCLIVGAHNP